MWFFRELGDLLLQCNPLWYRGHLAICVWPWELGLWELAQMLLLLPWVVKHPPVLTQESPSPPEPWDSGSYLVRQNLRPFTALDQVMLSQGNSSKHGSWFTRLTSLEMVCLRSPPTWTQRQGLCQTHSQWWAISRLQWVHSELLSATLMDINAAFVYCILKASGLVSITFGTFFC